MPEKKAMPGFKSLLQATPAIPQQLPLKASPLASTDILPLPSLHSR
jgi:hypothetical protein